MEEEAKTQAEMQKSVEENLKTLSQLTEHIANKNTSIDSSMKALRKSIKIGEHLQTQIKGYKLSLQEISAEIEKKEQAE